MHRYSQWISGSVAAGVTLFAVGALFHFGLPLVASGVPPQFQNLAVFRPWDGWTSKYMAAHPFIYGFLFAAIFHGMRRWTTFPSGVRGGLVYGMSVFLVGALPVYALVFASLQVSAGVISSWVIQSFVQYTFAGVALGCVHDGVTVRVSTKLLATESSIWELLMLKSSFLFITRGMMSYTSSDEWPMHMFSEGNTLTTRVRPFGWGPSLSHTVHVERVDEELFEVETKEGGRLIRVWNHLMQVQPIAEGECIYTDRIQLNAGLATPLVWLFAEAFYRYRQKQWLNLMQSSAANTKADGSPKARSS